MLKKLQKKFISISGLGLFLMIFLLLLAINGIFFYQSNQHLESRLDLILGEVQPGNVPSPESEPVPPEGGNAPSESEALPPDNAPDSPENKPAPPEALPQPTGSGNSPSSSQFGFLPFFEGRLRIQSDGCLIYLSENGSVTEIRQNTSEQYSEEELTDLAASLVASGKSHGWSQYFKYRLVSFPDASGTPQTVIGLINASSDLYSMASVLVISLGIGILSFILVLLILIFASKRAVKPVAESYTKQKQFITDANHELKTPLTVISANNELARMIYGDSEWFDSIDKQVAKMNTLVRNLISLARMDEEQALVLSAFSLSDAVYDTAKSFENIIHSRDKLLTLDIEENITCVGEESKIRQVLAILMDNATKYCDEKGKIAVHLSAGKQLRIQVINDYAAVDTCELDKVFERFYRADKARTADGSYGLGLSIAKSIVEQHGGTISAKPLEHSRVCFEVLLPKGNLKA